MTLTADFSLRLDAFDLSVAIEACAGAVTAVVGHNGAGKTTLLRCIAGAVHIDTGTISLDGETLDAPPRVFVLPERRRVAVVYQDHRLFPHLSALGNVAFGLRAHGVNKREAHAAARAQLDRLHFGSFADAMPTELSGGEAQGVALARALAMSPRALLLDEPLAAIDARGRVTLRRELRDHLREFSGPVVLVTHDPVDALVLADDVVVLDGGRVEQSAPLRELTAHPRTPFVAELLGTNVLYGSADATTVTTDAGAVVVTADPMTGPVCVMVPLTAVTLHRVEPTGSARNRWRGTVTHLDVIGARVRVDVDGPVSLRAEVTGAAVTELALRPGGEVWMSVKATEITVYPR